MRIKTADLQVMLSKLSNVIPSRTTLPLEQCVRLRAEGGVLHGYAVDSGNGVSLELACACDGDLEEVFVDGTIVKIARLLSGDVTELSIGGTELNLHCEDVRSRHRLDVGPMPSIGGGEFVDAGILYRDVLSSIYSNAIPICYLKPGQYIASAVMFEKGSVYTTDGISAVRVSCPDLDMVATPPFSSISALAKVAIGDVRVSRCAGAIKFAGDDMILMSSEVSLAVPALGKLLFDVKRNNSVYDIDVAATRSALDGCLVYAQAAGKLDMHLDVAPDGITVCSCNDELRVIVSAEATTSETIAFDAKRIAAAMRTMGDTCEMHFTNPESPVLFIGGTCEYILYPMRFVRPL